MLLRIMSSLIQVKREVEDWSFEQNVEIPSRRDILTVNYKELLTPDSQKIKLSPLQHRRKQREQYRSNVNSLRELAAILPVPPQKRGKKRLTKKEVLNQVLRYIAFLHRHISNAKSLLKNNSVEIDENECCLNGEDSTSPEEAGQSNAEEMSPPSSSPNFKKMRLRNICPKPRKKKWMEKTEWRQMLKSRRCLYSEPARYVKHPQSEIQHEVDLTWQGTSLDTSSSSSGSQDNADRLQGRTLYLTLLEAADSREPEGSSLDNLGKHEMQHGTKYSSEIEERKMDFNHDSSLYDPPVSPPYPSLKDQKLVHYLSSHDEDDEVDRSPWLPQEYPRGAAEVHSPVSNSRTASGLQASLGLSPSLFSSPARHVQLLQDGKENLTQALFGTVCLSPEFPVTKPGDLKLSNTRQSQQLHNSYWNAPIKDSDESEHWFSFSDDIEDNDITWTPYYRGKLSQPATSSKLKRGKSTSQGQRRKRCCALQLKKKCVNGFIMFCRVNRRLYISDHPGTASTVATKALAHVWRTMSKNQRRPYCIKAREFSKMNNRIVRLASSSSEEKEEVEMPKPLHLL
ncbi:meiosis initiator protein-like isoform X3 [Leucoraja erinacea]|uniref:meiosis initiator protein-like isoform X3 n=1 Tax=Leucoraja erinaceus TaxID=7782 RepID=UPI002457E98D|nr:meiosis initiator protein-like isoform X3 [Leucoraja erinacea]